MSKRRAGIAQPEIGLKSRAQANSTPVIQLFEKRAFGFLVTGSGFRVPD
jgi:hypothetical protein